jgi:tetratricopeptide (TPR) repeat protein
MFNWLFDLIDTVFTSQTNTLPSLALLNKTLVRYEQSLQFLSEDHKTQLEVLLSRDQVDKVFSHSQSISVEIIQQAENLDVQFKSKKVLFSPEQLTIWRETVHPNESAWWWWVDKQSAELVQHNNLPWDIATGTIFVLTVPLLLDIIRRLWSGAPDVVSVLGTLLTLLLTASPLVTQGRQITINLFKSIFNSKPEMHIRMMAWMSLGIFLAMLAIQQWLLPYPLATYYNNLGVAARAQGNIQQAEGLFKRAAALNPDRVVPYQNLAEAYQQIGFIKEAESWYQKAIQGDANFAPAYVGLGQVYNESGDFAAAERVLLAGLRANFVSDDDSTLKVTKYTLLSNLGWSYFGQGKLELAKETLLEVLKLEPELRTLGDSQGVEYRLALPHFYLAQIYEQDGDAPNAKQQWEDCLRFLDAENLPQRERVLTALEHLQSLKNK